MELIYALTLGLMGSFHCVGMCGPIALAIPLRNDSWLTRISGSLFYNVGRAVTYAIMGAIFGLLGQGLAMGGFQRWVSIIMGALMVLSVFFPGLFQSQYSFEKKGQGFVSSLKMRLRKLLQQRSYKSLFTIGLLNGLLPCGLVYIAIAGAIATSNVLTGTLYMFVFGLGTLPMLFALSILGNVVGNKLRQRINKLIPIVVVIIGLLFIVRGLGLGIPYLSPPEKKLVPHEKMEMQDMRH